jgi:Zn-dependent peptidase ImmA (M78 family)
MPDLNSQQKRVGYCRDLARKLLKDHGIVAPPIPVAEVAQKEGFSAKYIQGEPNSFSGILHRDLKAIGINADHPKVRQRFSIAHELGHFYLQHPQEEESVGIGDDSEEWKICESEANEFAGELLVPRDMLKVECDNLKKKPLEEKIQALLLTFNVSREVLIIQLTKYNLLMKL